MLDGRYADRQKAAAPAPYPAVTATATVSNGPTATPTASPTVASIGPAAMRTARAYVLASTTWSAGTYRAAHRAQVGLAAPGLRRQLSRTRPTAAQLAQLANDRESRVGAVLQIRPGDHARTNRARVLVDVDELHIRAGRRWRQVIAYRVDLLSRRGAWRVTAFGAIRGGDR